MKKYLFPLLVTVFITVASASAQTRELQIFNGGNLIPSFPVSNIDSAPVTFDDSDELETGLYMGIIGFNEDVIDMGAMKLLTSNTKYNYVSFVNSLTTEKNTVLYYAVDQALDKLTTTPLPSNLSNVAIITFTDGLDQGSLGIVDYKYSTRDEYRTFLANRIQSAKVQGLPLSAYSIGLRGGDVTNNDEFSKNLSSLASSADNVTEATNMDDVNERFHEIAEQLINITETQIMSIRFPKLDEVQTFRFTFDNVTDASESKHYIEGTMNARENTLENVKYVGLTCSSGAFIQGTASGKSNVVFDFENVQMPDGTNVTLDYINEYYWEGTYWQVNSQEFDRNEDLQVNVIRSSAAIMLVLDCSSSLQTKDDDKFTEMKNHVKTFIETLASAMEGEVLADGKVITETTVSTADPSTTVTHKLYNAENNVILSLTEGTSQTVYTYDEFGHCTQEDFTNFLNPNLDRTYKYTYNNDGRIETVEELAGERSLGTDTYTYDDHGRIATRTPSALPMPITYVNEYDAKGHLIKTTITFMGRDMGTTTYEYTGNLLTKESSISGGELTGYITYAYDGNNNRTTTTRYDAEGNPTSLTNYTYGEIDSYYAPTNVNAMANEDNTVTITWEGSANAVVCNGEWIEVSGNSYTTAVLLDGEYSFYVANNSNAVVTDPIDVYDTSKVGVSNVQVTGDIYGEMTTITDYYGEEKEVLAYMIPVSWTLPEGAQPQSYRIYYNATYSVTVDDGTLRSYTIPAVNTTNYVMGQGVVTLPFEIRVVAVYATGEVEPANVVSYTLEQTEAIISAVGISDIKTAANAPAEFYSLDGVRVPASNAKHGTFIVRQGNTVRKLQMK